MKFTLSKFFVFLVYKFCCLGRWFWLSFGTMGNDGKWSDMVSEISRLHFGMYVICKNIVYYTVLLVVYFSRYCDYRQLKA